MLTDAARRRLTVVLVGARNPQNIGAAARAMQDFGFSDLRIVNEYAAPFEAAQLEAAKQDAVPKSAVGAAGVMHAARRFDSLAEAIGDCALVVGTTAIGGRELNQPIQALQHTASHMLDALASEIRVALLFGSEKTGLTNEQLSHCQRLLTIPLYAPEEARHLSMNLGQSVAVCLYELTREGFDGSRELPELHEAPATSADRERLTQRLLETMKITGYARRFPANAREHIVRRLAQQLGATHDEAATWLGFFRQIARHPVEPGDPK